jgi:protein transport protein SEC61 subunit alpha
MSGNDPF